MGSSKSVEAQSKGRCFNFLLVKVLEIYPEEEDPLSYSITQKILLDSSQIKDMREY